MVFVPFKGVEVLVMFVAFIGIVAFDVFDEFAGIDEFVLDTFVGID